MSVIFSNLIKQIPPPFPDADKVLVLAHREELLDQAYKQIKKYSDLVRTVSDFLYFILDKLYSGIANNLIYSRLK